MEMKEKNAVDVSHQRLHEDMDHSHQVTSASDEDDHLDEYYSPGSWSERLCNKGTISNLITFTIMVIGFILRETLDEDSDEGVAAKYILFAGLFGFAGGITNWLAVTMLFDEIPGLYGSGVIPRRFKEIRLTVKTTIMRTFFDQGYMDKWMKDRMQQIDAEAKIKEYMATEDGSKLIEEKLKVVLTQNQQIATLFGMVAMMNPALQGPEGMLNFAKPIFVSLLTQAAPVMMEAAQPDPETMRQEIDKMMTDKLETLTPPVVKRLMESVIRKHLGWLIVWGNFFGGLIGIISGAAIRF